MKSVVIQKDNNKYGKFMPIEDAYCVRGDIFCVADGITRDPTEITDFTGKSKEEVLSSYPNPSLATLAAQGASEAFVAYMATHKRSAVSAKNAIIAANQKVAIINQDKPVDYLINDFAGCVVAGGVIEKGVLYWASIGDCQLSIFDSHGREKFKTPNGVAAFRGLREEASR